MEDELNRLKTDYEQIKHQNQEVINQEIIQLRQTNDVSINDRKMYIQKEKKIHTHLIISLGNIYKYE